MVCCDKGLEAVGAMRRWRARARRLATYNLGLADYVNQLLGENADQAEQIIELNEKVATLSKLCFGPSTERGSRTRPRDDHPETPAAPSRSSGDATAGEPATEPADEQDRRRGQRRGTKGHGRRDYSGLPSTEEVHELDEDERACPHCGLQHEHFDDETSSQIDWQVRLVRVIHRRKKYRRSCSCPSKAVVVAPVVPKPIRKGLFSAGFLARLVHEKYVLGRPIARVLAALSAEGLELSKGTLCGVLRAVSDLLEPLDQAIRVRNAKAAQLNMDETRWEVFEELEGKKGHRWYLWVFVATDTVVFHIDPTRSGAVLEAHLGVDLSSGALEPGRSLVVSSDFYVVYQSLSRLDGVEALWCFSHIRRYFIRAGDSDKSLGEWRDAWLGRFAALYRAHHVLRAHEPGTEPRADAEADFTLALEAIDLARKKESLDEDLPVAAKKVLATLNNEWEGLKAHAKYLELDLDNNRAERFIRNPVVGRKNFYGSGAIWAASLAGRAWTVTATAKLFGLNPLTYLTSYFEACARAGGKAPDGEALEAFLPWIAGEVTKRAPSTPDPGP